MKPREDQAPKKPYSTPKMVNYGDLRSITQTGGRADRNDRINPGNDKTI